MTALREWVGASNDTDWPRTLRLLLGMTNLAAKDRKSAEAALLRSCAKPQLEAEHVHLESSIVARTLNEYKWILDFSDSFPVLGPEAMAVSLSFLEDNVPDSPNALSRRSSEEFSVPFEHVIRWLYVATRLEGRRGAGELSVPEAYYLAPAVRCAVPALSEKTRGRERRPAVAFEASVAQVVERILDWCDRWHGYGDSPAFIGDVGRRRIDRYYGLAVLVELLPHISAVMRRRIFVCIEAEIHWIPPMNALALIGALIENAEPDEIDHVATAERLDRENPHWIRALLLSRTGFPAGAQRCDLGVAILRYVVGLAFQGPSACLLGSAELSAHTDDIASHVRFDIASLLAGVVDSACSSTTRPVLE
jgi:hypothetical protein